MTESLAETKAHMAELLDVVQTSTTPGWMRIMTRLEEMALQAQEDMIGAGDKPDIVLAPLARRWIQREAFVRDIKLYLASCKTEQDDLIKSLDDRSVPHAEQD